MRQITRALFVTTFCLIATTQLHAQGVWTQLTNTNPTGGTGTMMLLTDGTVVAQGAGITSEWSKLTPDAKGDYTKGTWTTIASMGIERLYYGSVVMPNGKMLVLGGEYSSASSFTNTGEIYDPIKNTWTPTVNFPKSQFGDDPTVLLNNGKILCGYVAGPETYLYDPSNNTFTQTGTKLKNDSSDEETFLLLPNGNVLAYSVFASPDTGVGFAQQYNPLTGKWSATGPVPVPLSGPKFGYELGPGTRLPDGRYLQIGANNLTAIYDLVTDKWTAGPALPANLGGDDSPGAMMPNGHFLFAADTSSPKIFTPPTRLFDFDYTTDTLVDVTPSGQLGGMLIQPAYILRMLVLPNGHILVGSASSQIVWDYQPSGSPQTAWQPTVTSVTATGAANTYILKGTQLTGISEGATYGDDVAMSTNYPIVRLKSGTGNVYYCRTTNWTPGIATGSLVTTCQFVVPFGLANGVYQLNVVASGISSASQPFTIGPVAAPSVVTAIFTAATNKLVLQGDKNPNSVTLTYQANVLTVEGANATKISILSADGKTVLSTGASQNFNPTGKLTIIADLAGGNDSVAAIGLDATSITVTLGDGNDNAAFSLCNIVNLSVDGGAGVDTLINTSSKIGTLVKSNFP